MRHTRSSALFAGCVAAIAGGSFFWGFLWRFNAALAIVLGSAAGLCLMACLGDRVQSRVPAQTISLDELQRKLELESLKRNYSR